MKTALLSLAKCLVVIGSLLGPLSLWAAEVKDLYLVSIAVTDRSDAERQRAVAEGFQQLLVRVSGDSGVSAADVLAAADVSADRYVAQYGYETRADSADSKGGIYLNVQYDPAAVHNLMLRSGLPLWSSDRPGILLWMAWEQGLDRELVNANSMPGPFRMLQDEAQRRGVAFRFPEFDADDQSLVSLGDIWGMFPEPVLSASRRYDTPVVVMAKVKESTRAIQINAMLQLDGQPYWFEVTRSDTAAALRLLVDRLVDKIASKYAVVSSSEGTQQWVLAVEGVRALKDYAALARYLDRLVAISQYQLQAVEGDQARFLLHLNTDLAALEQTFRLDGKLIVVEPAPAARPPRSYAGEPAQPGVAPEAPVMPVTPNMIRYQWRG